VAPEAVLSREAQGRRSNRNQEGWSVGMLMGGLFRGTSGWARLAGLVDVDEALWSRTPNMLALAEVGADVARHDQVTGCMHHFRADGRLTLQ
jgi:hypothetical protein